MIIHSQWFVNDTNTIATFTIKYWTTHLDIKNDYWIWFKKRCKKLLEGIVLYNIQSNTLGYKKNCNMNWLQSTNIGTQLLSDFYIFSEAKICYKKSAGFRSLFFTNTMAISENKQIKSKYFCEENPLTLFLTNQNRRF